MTSDDTTRTSRNQTLPRGPGQHIGAQCDQCDNRVTRRSVVKVKRGPLRGMMGRVCDECKWEVTEVICVILPVKIVSVANLREHWRQKSARTQTHRGTAGQVLRAARSDPPIGPVEITLTRIAPRVLDDDNLASGFKAVRDGVADWLRIDDGDKSLTWRYAQRKGKPGEYAAEVVVSFAV